MTMRRLAGFAAAAAGLGFGTAAAQPMALVEGVWLTDSLTELTIAACPAGYCGYISKIVVPADIQSQYAEDLARIPTEQFVDANNKDPNLRGRPIQGLQILQLRATGSPFYFEGEIYNPQDGNIYSGSVQVTGADSIVLKGCFMYVLCQEQIWVRVLTPPESEPAAQ